MSFGDHIAACNNYDPSARGAAFCRRRTGSGCCGATMPRRCGDFRRSSRSRTTGCSLLARGDVAAVSRAVDAVVDALVAEKRVPKWRNETFDVAAALGCATGVPPRPWRRAVLRNARLRRPPQRLPPRTGTLHLWVGRRAPDKRVAPDKLDNLVAGGIGNGHGLEETLLKEGEEEASIPRSLTSHAVPVGAVSYRMETELGIRDDVLFVYDLEMPADFMPKNQDGEIVHFELMPASAVLDRVRTTDDFKFNVNLVILDFALRHGLLRPDDPEYLDVATGLHRPLD